MRYEDWWAGRQYLATFAARTDAYTNWTGTSWVCVREELTPRGLYDAFRDGQSLSGYINAPDNQTHVAAWDFDTEDGLALARQLRATMLAAGARPYVEPSRRGAHLWCILRDRRPARTVRRAMRGFLAAALIPESPKIELRPSHDEIKPDGFGSPLRLPTMAHPKTGRRYPLLDMDDSPLPGTLLGMLGRIDTTPTEVFDAMAAKVPVKVADLDRSYRPPVPRWHDDGEGTASDILRELWGVQKAAAGRTVKCPAHSDDFPSLSILRDDERAICKSPSCILHNDGHGRGTKELRRLASADTMTHS